MPIEWDNSPELPPLIAPKPPAIPAEALLTIAEVHLAAGDIPRGILRMFYHDTIGLEYLGEDDAGVRFRQLQRRIVLSRDRTEPGHVGFLIRNFDEALVKLRDLRLPHEVIHADSGLTRMVLLRDPAGNWVQLIETRSF